METTDDEVLPISLFVDAVPYSHVDSCIGFWVVNEITKCRHLVVALRKHLVCGCGCRGWCTFWAVFRALAWSFAALAAGRHPSVRHDGSPWHDEDVKLRRMSGTKMQVKAAVLYIKGDWAEY